MGSNPYGRSPAKAQNGFPKPWLARHKIDSRCSELQDQESHNSGILGPKVVKPHGLNKKSWSGIGVGALPGGVCKGCSHQKWPRPVGGEAPLKHIR